MNERQETKMDTVRTTPYGFGIRSTLPFAQAVETIKARLQEQGFGILTEIDVRRTLHEKIGVDWRPYVILGACNPRLAHQALRTELDIGLLLPCNVVVYEDGDGSVVEVMDPESVLGLVENPQLPSLAREVKASMRRALDGLPA